MSDVPRNGDAPRQGRDARTTTVERSPCSLADQADASQAVQGVTLEVHGCLVLLVTADGCRRVLARLNALEPVIDAGSES